MRNKFMAALFAAAVSFTALTGYADGLSFTASVDSDGIVSISGKGNSGYLSVEIFQSEEDRITNGGVPGVADSIIVGNDGEFSFTRKLDVNKTGEYKVVIGNTDVKTDESERTKTIYFASVKEIDNAIAEINSADESSIADKLEKNKLYLQISDIVDGVVYRSNKNFIGKYLLEIRPADGFADITALTAALKESVGIAALANADSDKFAEYMKEYAPVLKLNDYYELKAGAQEYSETVLYTKLKTAMAACVSSVMSEYLKESEIKNVEGIKSGLRRVEAVASVNTAARGSVISEIDSYRDVFEINTSGLTKKVSETIAENICVTNQNKAYPTVAAVVSAYNSAYKAATQQTSGGNSGTGGTGGGGAGGGISSGGNSNSGINGDFKIEPVKEENTEPEDLFTDLASSDWAREYINRLAQSGIINGKGNGKFEPESYVTREEFAKMISGALKLDAAEEPISFTDVDRDEWYAPYISSAAAAGLVRGYADGSFGIGKSITREEAAVLIYRAAVNAGKNTSPSSESGLSFTDAEDISEFATEGVKGCVELKIIQGNDNNMFLPNNSITRAECAKMICCLLDIV